MRKSTTVLAAGAVAAVASGLAGTSGATAAGDGARAIPVQLLSFNDYHGHLEATDRPLASDPPPPPPVGWNTSRPS